MSSNINGNCDPRFGQMADLLSANIDSGADCGASIAVMLDGELVVDMWGGYTDPERTTPWQRDTITNVWSSTKTITSLCALINVERGLIDLDAPVATYWPEFAANGKDDVLVKQLMSHTSGVSGWDQPFAVEDMYDWELSTSRLAEQAPWWEPGTASGYHALNQGHLVGEVIRRTAGVKLGKFLAQELAGPLDIDFHIGLPSADFDRVSNVIPPPPLPIDMSQLDPDSVVVKTFTGPSPSAESSWTPAWRQADIGAANGHGNARSLAQLNSILTNGGAYGGKQFLSSDTIEHIFDVQADGVDQVLGVPTRFGIGFGLPSEAAPHLDPSRPICFWGGWGGSTIVNVLDRNLTVAYVMNRMEGGLVGDERGTSLVAAAIEAVG